MHPANETQEEIARIAAAVAEQRAYCERHFPTIPAAGMQSGVSVKDVELLLELVASLSSGDR